MEQRRVLEARRRVAAGHSHRRVARAAGVHHKTIQRWLIADHCPCCGDAMDYRAALCGGCRADEVRIAWDTRARQIEEWYGRDELPWTDLVERLRLTPPYVRQLLDTLRLQGYNVPTRFKRVGGRLVASNVLA